MGTRREELGACTGHEGKAHAPVDGSCDTGVDGTGVRIANKEQSARWAARLTGWRRQAICNAICGVAALEEAWVGVVLPNVRKVEGLLHKAWCTGPRVGA